MPGSDKRFCFLLPPKGKTNRVAVYEAAIEPMAHLTLEGTTDKWRLSLGGIYAPDEGQRQEREAKKPLALDAFLSATRRSRKSRSAPTTTLPGAGQHPTLREPIRAGTAW